MSLSMQRALRRIQKVPSDPGLDETQPTAPPVSNPQKTGPKPLGALQTNAAVRALRKRAGA